MVSHKLIFCQSFHYLARKKQSKGAVQVFRGAYGKLAILRSMCKDGKKIIILSYMVSFASLTLRETIRNNTADMQENYYKNLHNLIVMLAGIL